MEGHKKDIITASTGDYWRLLMPGKYRVTASAKGFAPVTKTISVQKGPAQQLNFIMNQSGSSKIFHDKPNPVEDSQPSPEEGTVSYQVQSTPQTNPMAGAGGNIMDGNINLDNNYGYGQGGGLYGGGFADTGGSYEGGFGVLNGGFSNGYGINMLSNPESSPGGPPLNIGENLMRYSPNGMEMSGPLQDGALDRLAMMSPYETQSKDTESASISAVTDDKDFNENNFHSVNI